MRKIIITLLLILPLMADVFTLESEGSNVFLNIEPPATPHNAMTATVEYDTTVLCPESLEPVSGKLTVYVDATETIRFRRLCGGDSYLTCKAVISPDIHSSRLTADVSTTVLQIETELSVEENQNIENGLAVFPNPFSDLLTVNFVGEGDAQIQIFDVLGTQITSGRRSLTWDGRDQNGVKLPNGIYFAAVKVKGNVQLKKIFLCK